MSTLDERLRSLREAKELLLAVTLDARVDEPLRAAAVQALVDYPGNVDIERLLHHEDPAVVEGWARALLRTQSVLHALAGRLPVEDNSLRWARGVDRHFPEAHCLPGYAGRPTTGLRTF